MIQSLNHLDQIFAQRNKFIVLGLTGRTGSGCSTLAGILSKGSFNENQFEIPKNSQTEDNDDRRYRICYNFIKKNWKPFHIIRIRDVIALEIFIKGLNVLVIEYPDLNKDEIKLNLLNVLFKKFEEKKRDLPAGNLDLKKINRETTSEELRAYYKFFVQELPTLCENLYTLISSLDSENPRKPFQDIGNNLRRSGDPYLKEVDDSKMFYTAEYCRLLIKLIRYTQDLDGKGTYIVIDSIRNPYEAFYLKERFSSFYLLAISTISASRIKRLHNRLSDDHIAKLDEIENNKDEFNGKKTDIEKLVSQDIPKCLEAADLFITNNDSPQTYKDLKKQIVKYLSLILHPGIVPPTAIERNMQIAYTARLNSGCISRQVGAAITDDEFSLKAVGWNNTPRGQVPCVLRSYSDLIKKDRGTQAFSEFELGNDKFRTNLMEKMPLSKGSSISNKGLNLCYCFKDGYNSFKKEQNQVHTRSLHAEENAFLQITKYGGEGVKGGYLFTTASPCELCSKKAFQLGIKRVYYIDPYPGIASDHILGYPNISPELILFNGAIGRAYVQLYQPVMSYKDETSFRFGGNPFEEKQSQNLAPILATAVTLPNPIKDTLGQANDAIIVAPGTVNDSNSEGEQNE